MERIVNDLFSNSKHNVCSYKKQTRVNFLFMTDDNEINKIEAILKRKGIRVPDFQKTLRIQSQHWNNWKRRGVPGKRLIEIAEILREPGLLINETHQTANTSPQNIESNAHETLELGRFSPVPVVGTTQLGDNGHWSDLEYPVGHGDGSINYPTRDKNAYALRCVGDSMKPRIKDGEFVIVEPNGEPIPGDEVLVKSLDGRVMVKTFLYIRDGRVHLMSVNEAHPPQSLLLDEIDKIHPIAAIVKKSLWTPGE